jgi:hypothetical protein
VSEGEESCAEEDVGGEVEGGVEARALGEEGGGVLRGGQRGEVEEGEGEGEVEAVVVLSPGGAGAREAQAQGVVVAQQVEQSGLEELRLEGLLELQEEGLVEVVEGGLRGGEEGELDGSQRRLSGDGALLRQRGGGGGGEVRSQLRDGLVLEEELWREVEASAASAGDELEAEDGVAAELEEVVVDADAVEAKDLSPEGGQPLFDRVGGRRVGESQLRARGVRRRKRLAVELCVGGEREGVEANEGGGEHVLRQAQLEEGAQLGGVDVWRDEVGDEASVRRIPPGQDEGIADGGVRAQSGLHLGELHTEAAHFDLVVATAEELEDTVRTEASPVAGAVHASAGRGGEGVGEELLSRQLRGLEVAASQAVP